MSNPSDKSEGGFYEPIVWSLGTALLVSGFALTLLMWSHVIGPFRFTSLDAHEASSAVGLWIPQASGRSVPPETAERLVRWRDALAPDRPAVTHHRLAELARQGVGVVVVPDARGLTPKQASALWRFVAEGHGAVLTGPVGVRDAAGGWLGFELMSRLLGGAPVSTLRAEQTTRLAAWSRGPLSAGLAPAEAIRMAPSPGAPAVDDPDAELRWGDADDAGPVLAAARRLEVGDGRVVWLGAGPESTWEPSREPWQAMVRLLDASLDWAAGRPRVEVLPWPDAAPFAALVAEVPHPDPDEAAVRSGAALRARLRDAPVSGRLVRIEIPEQDLPEATRSALRREARDLLQRAGAWTPSPVELEAWQRRRDRVAAALERSGPERWLLRISNVGSESVEGVVLRLHANRSILRATVVETTVLQGVPRTRTHPDRESVDVWMPELPAGSSLAYHVDLEASQPWAARADGPPPVAAPPPFRPGRLRPMRSGE